MTITKADFMARVEFEPTGDDLDRCNCPRYPGLGHQWCGWCEHDHPRFCCPKCMLKFAAEHPGTTMYWHDGQSLARIEQIVATAADSPKGGIRDLTHLKGDRMLWIWFVLTALLSMIAGGGFPQPLCPCLCFGGVAG